MYLEQYGGRNDVWIAKVLYRQVFQVYRRIVPYRGWTNAMYLTRCFNLFCRMFVINNDILLQTAKADFRDFQRLCRLELHGLNKWLSSPFTSSLILSNRANLTPVFIPYKCRWCDRKNLQMYGVSPKRVLQAYFLAAASIFETNRATERLGWARAAVLAEAVSSHFRCSTSTNTTRERFVIKLSGARRSNVERFLSCT
jgi:hypothetical protein